jgi:hypothetical protein
VDDSPGDKGGAPDPASIFDDLDGSREAQERGLESMFADPPGPLGKAPRPNISPKRQKGLTWGIVDPFAWHRRAAKMLISAKCGAAALAVADVILFEWNANMQQPVRLSTSMLRAWGISRKVKAEALARLEAARLIDVDRANGRNPVVTVLAVPARPLRQPV